MSRSPHDYLRHILDETKFLMNRSRGLTQDRFVQDETLKRAFIRSLEIIGEAARQIPADLTRAQPPGLESDGWDARPADTCILWRGLRHRLGCCN